jgi:hypothetical protein
MRHLSQRGGHRWNRGRHRETGYLRYAAADRLPVCAREGEPPQREQVGEQQSVFVTRQ